MPNIAARRATVRRRDGRACDAEGRVIYHSGRAEGRLGESYDYGEACLTYTSRAVLDDTVTGIADRGQTPRAAGDTLGA